MIKKANFFRLILFPLGGAEGNVVIHKGRFTYQQLSYYVGVIYTFCFLCFVEEGIAHNM
jgi:hypothetical protein